VSGPHEVDRPAVEAGIVASLGVHVQDLQLPSLVDEFVSTWGLVRVDDVPAEKYWEMVGRHFGPQVG
jgi:hypothetical protein